MILKNTWKLLTCNVVILAKMKMWIDTEKQLTTFNIQALSMYTSQKWRCSDRATINTLINYV